MRSPWPWWPFLLAIAVFCAGYTWIRVAYARPQRATEPWADRQVADAGPLAGPHPWSTSTPLPAPTDAPPPASTRWTYLPTASGIPREFARSVDPATRWPDSVDNAAALRDASGLRFRLSARWSDTPPPPGWVAFSRDALPAPAADAPRPGTLRLLREDLERSVFLDAHVLLLPQPTPASPTPGNPADVSGIDLFLPHSSLPPGPFRLIVPTQRGLAWLELPAAPGN